MSKCKCCGKPVISAPIFHAACVERAVNEDIMPVICEQFCKWPYLIEDQEEMDQRCDSCDLEKTIINTIT